MFDFDRVIDRRNTHSMKWDAIAKYSGLTAPDTLPLWVADMDFAAPPGVTAALEQEVRRATNGYYADTGSWTGAFVAFMARRHQLAIDPATVSAVPGIVSGLGLIIQAISEPGDEIAVFPPAYHAFRKIISANDRRILDVPLAETQGRYEIDFDLFRRSVTPRTKAVFLSSPHNPGGTCWSADELRALAHACAERNIVLVSDEIHCDLLFHGAKHIPTIVAAPEYAHNIISCFAATKTFNIAGAHAGACVTTDAALRRKLEHRINASGLASYNSFGMLATEAAWRTGDDWLDALLPYLEANRNHFDREIERIAPGARSMRLDSTYLAWVDFRSTGLAPTDVADRIAKRARIFANPGDQFGPGGTNRVRFNFATPRATLDLALGRLDEAFRDIRTGG